MPHTFFGADLADGFDVAACRGVDGTSGLATLCGDAPAFDDVVDDTFALLDLLLVWSRRLALGLLKDFERGGHLALIDSLFALKPGGESRFVVWIGRGSGIVMNFIENNRTACACLRHRSTG